MTVEIISRSISTKVWDRAGIKLATPRIAVRHASVARHVTDCATRPGIIHLMECSISKLAASKIPLVYLASVVEQAGLDMT